MECGAAMFVVNLGILLPAACGAACGESWDFGEVTVVGSTFVIYFTSCVLKYPLFLLPLMTVCRVVASYNDAPTTMLHCIYGVFYDR